MNKLIGLHIWYYFAVALARSVVDLAMSVMREIYTTSMKLKVSATDSRTQKYLQLLMAGHILNLTTINQVDKRLIRVS